MDNRNLILLNALKLFATRGYDAVGVQEIVERSGLTKPTLYHYFGSKKGLLEAILNEYGSQLHHLIRGSSLYKGDLSVTLEKVATVYFEFAREHALFYRMQLAMYFAPPESEPNQMVRRMNESHHQFIEELFRQAANHHRNMKGHQLTYAATFVGTINTYIGFALNGYIEWDKALIYQAVRQFMHGIYV